jgi:hypothetical protein
MMFIVMDLLTLLAYPIVFVHGKLRQFSKSQESVPAPNLLVTVPVTPSMTNRKIMNMLKKRNLLQMPGESNEY